MSRMENLPPHILLHILGKLPVRYVIRLKFVSKSWFSLLSSSEFATHYQSTSYEDDPNNRFIAFTGEDLEKEGQHCSLYQVDLDDRPLNPVVKIQLPSDLEGMNYKRVLSSCNGLLLCVCSRARYTTPNFVLLNPSTNSYQKIPSCGVFFSKFKLGLGYDCKSDDYKIVIVTLEKTSPSTIITRISLYSLKAGSWRVIPQPPKGLFGLFHLKDEEFRSTMSIAALIDNHLLHWVLTFDSEHNKKQRIACFDVCSENWTEVPVPKTNDGHNWRYLGTLNSKLCLVSMSTPTVGRYKDKVWVMNEYGNEESWAPLYDVYDSRNPGLLRGIDDIIPIAYSNEGSEVFLKKHWRDLGFWYNFQEKRIRIVEVCDVIGLPCSIHEPVFGIRSLARIPRGNYLGLHQSAPKRRRGSEESFVYKEKIL